MVINEEIQMTFGDGFLFGLGFAVAKLLFLLFILIPMFYFGRYEGTKDGETKI